MEDILPAKLSKKASLYGFLVFAITFATGLIIALSQYQIQLQNEQNDVENVSEIIEQNIERIISDSYVASLSLALTLNDEGVVERFDSVAQKLLNDYSTFDVVEMVPGGIIEYVYPLEGNEAVLGYDIGSDPQVNAEVRRAAEMGRMYFAGPIDLRQGGRAAIGRYPIFLDGSLWGYTAVLIHLETLFEESEIYEFRRNGYYIQFSKANPNTGKEEFFLPLDSDIDLNDAIMMTFPEGDWTIYAAKVSRTQPVATLLLIGGFSLIGALLLGYLSYELFRKPDELRKIIKKRTQELIASREKFRKNSELLASILESPKEMVIFCLDKDFNYLVYNQNYEELARKLYGVSISVGDNILKLFSAEEKEFLQQKYQMALKGESFEYLHELKYPDGTIEYWQNRFSPITDKKNNINGLTVFSVNVTQRVETEKLLEKNERQYRALISNTPFCIHELNKEAELISINKAGYTMFGFKREEDMLGITYPELLGEEKAKGILDLFDKSLKGISTEFEFEKADRFFSSSFIPIKDKDGEIIRIMGITQDITERRRSEELIEQSLNEKIILLAEVHHRVKNNLAIISGLLELQRSEINDPHVKHILSQSINRVISIAMVHELMYTATDFSSINIHNYLEMLIPAISKAIQDERKKVEFKISIDNIKMNINRAIPLGLLLNELITNSFKYAFQQKEGNEILISLTAEDERIVIVYEDNGVGFDEDTDFNSPKNLGLSLVQAQLQQLDASFSVDTENRFMLSFSFDAIAKGSHSNIKH